MISRQASADLVSCALDQRANVGPSDLAEKGWETKVRYYSRQKLISLHVLAMSLVVASAAAQEAQKTANLTKGVDVLDTYRGQSTEFGDALKRVADRLEVFSKHMKEGEAILAGWKTLAKDFDQYRVTAEERVADCRSKYDEMVQKRNSTRNLDTLRMRESAYNTCQEVIRRDRVENSWPARASCESRTGYKGR